MDWYGPCIKYIDLETSPHGIYCQRSSDVLTWHLLTEIVPSWNLLTEIVPQQTSLFKFQKKLKMFYTKINGIIRNNYILIMKTQIVAISYNPTTFYRV